ncbi:hypothetical protein KIL84_023168 [Mauremys mutica]|uniref:Uncharacterized protein n=1 Tax=Mauremys mutica TaxID=74926 RepID=A0A9D3WLU8_9SAUR|nr:hypothetical protein KIL84_023168 [Mauremys mutica]
MNSGSQLRPDIVITNEGQKKIMMMDVTVPFENRTQPSTMLELKRWRSYCITEKSQAEETSLNDTPFSQSTKPTQNFLP